MKVGAKTLYPHQETAVRWMIRQEDEDIHGGFLCDDMGLGKTWTVLGLLSETAGECPKTLLLCPLVVAGQWLEAAAQANINAYVYSKGHHWTRKHRAVCLEKGDKCASIYIANYERIKENASILTEFDRLVIDEAHILRNQASERYNKIYNLAKEIPRTWCLTGTPLVNRIADVEALYRLIRGNRLESTIGDFPKACELFRSYAIGRSMEDIGMPLGERPTDTEVILDFDTTEEAEFYRLIQGQIARQMTLFEELDASNNAAIFKLLLRLRQISIHPQVYIQGQRRSHGRNYGRADWTGRSSTKVAALRRIIECSQVSHNWVVFCNFQDEIELLRKELAGSHCIGAVETYHGAKDVGQRAADLAMYKQACERNTHVSYSELCGLFPGLPDDVCGIIGGYLGPVHNVLLVQIHCGGTGLNLQENDRVVFMSPWWTSALMKQAVGRVYRMGQKKPVAVYRLMLKEEASLNIDRKMMDKAQSKEELCAELLACCVKG